MANGLQPFYLLQSAFTGGEISDEVSNRVDLDKYQYAVLQARNCLIKPYGPIYKRPGLKYVNRTKYVDKRSILVAFNGSDDKDYLLEIGEKYIRVYKNGIDLNVEMVTPYLESDLTNLRFTQSADTMFIASGKYPVKQLARYSDSDWRFGDFEITDMYFDASLEPEALKGTQYKDVGTYSFKPSESGRYIITIAGGGGGGGGGYHLSHGGHYFGGNGGRGEVVRTTMILDKDTTYQVVVGGGGAGGVNGHYNSNNTSGANGGNSSFNNVVSRGGGGGQRAQRNTNGAGGASYGNGGYGGSGGGWNEGSAGSGSAGWVLIVFNNNNSVKPSATKGNITLTSEDNLFSPSSVGSSIMLKQDMPSKEVSTSNGTSEMVLVGENWKVISHGTWTGSFEVEKSNDGGVWESYRKYTSKDDYNPSESGSVTKSMYMRIKCNVSSGTCNVNLMAMPYEHEGIAKITAYSNAKSVSAIVTKEFGTTTATSEYFFGAWSEAFGYPKTVCFFQDRLCFGGNSKQPYMVWMSRTGDYGNFSVEKASGTVTDDSAVAVAFVSRKQFKILHLLAGTDLVILTAGNEWTISGSDTVTPNKCVPKMQTARGCNNCEPLMIGGRIVFVQGRGSTVRDMGYSFETDSYGGTDLTLLAKHLIEGVDIVDSDYKQEPDSTIYFVCSDGTMICLAYILEQKVYAWSSIETDGSIESVATIQEGDEDVVYVVVKRVIGDKVVRNLEYFYNNSTKSNNPDDYIMLDSALVRINDSKEITPTSFDVMELAGAIVNVVGDGRVYKNIAVSQDGVLTLPTAVRHAVIGLPYKSVIELPNVEIRTSDGTMQGRYKQVSTCIIRLRNSLGGLVGCDEQVLDQIQYDELSAVNDIKLFSGDKKTTLPIGGFNNEGRIVIRNDDPYPFNLLMVVREVSFGG